MPDSPIESPVVWGRLQTCGGLPTRLPVISQVLLPLGCLIALSLFTTACFTTQAKPVARVFVPPPVQPSPVATSSPLPLSPGPDLDIAPLTSLAEIVELPLPEYPAPPKPAPTPRRVSPAKTVAPESVPAPAPPKITQYFSDQDRQRYEQEYLASQDHTKRNLAILESRKLSRSQQQTLERIRTFKDQAEQQYELDPVSAVNLARRADALSTDLINRLR